MPTVYYQTHESEVLNEAARRKQAADKAWLESLSK
jgi:hypothetical protein